MKKDEQKYQDWIADIVEMEADQEEKNAKRKKARGSLGDGAPDVRVVSESGRTVGAQTVWGILWSLAQWEEQFA